MLKWSIANKREEKGGGGSGEQRRRSTAGICTMRERSAGKATKRRRSSTTRRSGASRRSGVNHLEIMDKENQYTSTPIKGSDDASPQDAFRDVSNLTPKDTSNRRRRTTTTTITTAKKCKSINRQLYSPKKKKQCIESHSQDFAISPDSSRFGNNYFRPFEAVDSHIEGLTSKDFNDLCGCKNAAFEDDDDDVDIVVEEKPTKTTSYAPTLPKFALEYSPCSIKGGASPQPRVPMQILSIQSKLADLCPPSKKAKIDHVNDFLQQISCFTSPEEDESKMLRFPAHDEDSKLTPLVKRFVDLRFSKLTSIEDSSNNLNNSSFINNLSLDKIVDAILDSSNDSSNNNNINNNNISSSSNSERECERAQERDNELNETQEENLINTEQEERQNYYSDRNSTDSGFRSSSVQSHELDANFTCKCSGTKKEEMTMINLDGTYNERCVDEDVNGGRKRHLSSSPSEEEMQVKRPLLDDNCALRRQKGIRRRRLDDNIKTPQTTITSEMTDANDHSFDSEDSDDVKHETFVVDVVPKVACSTPNARASEDRGTIDLQIDASTEELLINIFRCSDLRRTNGQPINAYVKVAVSERTGEGRRRRKGTLQRTAVQAESSSPVFEHVFKVPVQKTDLQKVLHVEVWHRDRATRRSEFLGCMSFVIKNAIKKNISGSYQLLPQSSSRCNQLSKMCESQSSVEDVVGGGGLFEDMEGEPKKTPCKVSLLQQQKDADENLFLRYLEFDPTEGPEAAPAAAQRKATGNKTNGRTPFTTTKMLRRAPKSGFGFSVVWTHPPRIERVEKGLPADKAGILPGDYLIFVDKHNVVMMPEIDILNLIRSFGNQLTLETFRRNASRNGSVPSVRRLMNFPETENSPGPTVAPASMVTAQRRPSTVCSTNTTSVEYNRKKLHLPQVTFSSERPTSSAEESRRKAMYQIITREQQYATSLQFSLARYVSALAERKDLIGANDHRTLFQNADELLRITEDVLDILVQEDGDYQTHLLLRTYHMKLNEMTGAYKRYCSGIQKADCVLANLLKNQEFVRFTQVPAIPRRRPDITVFVHKPLEHYREILKLFNVLLGQTKSHHDEYHAINHIVHELQVNYREMTSEAGLMEPMGEGRPLLSVQDLENRLVFTKCKPFVLSKPGRQWIFGGDLSRVEGRTVRQYWALLFSDILLFAKVSRDRVLFILEDPLPLSQITDFLFNVRKKANEFRIVLEPGGGKNATSPTVHCGPDLSRTPRKNPGRRCLILRTPTVELKAVWQNLLQRQIFHINAGMEGSSYSSPLESPDVPITSSVVTLQSADSLSLRRQWMKGQFGGNGAPAEAPDDDDFELWTEERVRKRSEELRLLNSTQHANVNGNNANDPAEDDDMRRCCESRCEDIVVYSDHEELSPSRSTNTTESQVTVRSSPLVPETVNVCRQCHRTCVQSPTMNGDRRRQDSNCKNNNCVEAVHLAEEEEEDWRPLVLMGLTAVNPTACLVKLDPFAAPPPQISVLPPTPELQMSITHSEFIPEDANCNCQSSRPQIGELILNKDYDNSPDDSPLVDEQPYHSLNSSNLTLKRYGTVSSLERVASDEQEDYDPRENSSDEESDYEVEEEDDQDEDDDDIGIDNEAFNHSSIMSWTARAGTFVAEKMAFFEKYLKNEITVNGDDGQEEETSGATSGEEIWGTPTSGGDLDDPLSSNCGDPRNSPNGEESLSSNEDTELMMDELLMTPPVTSSSIRGLLPRRTLEPLMEEEYSDTYTSSSSSTASSASNDSTPTRSSVSPKKGNGTGDAADECSAAAETPAAQTNSAGSDTPRTTASPYDSTTRTLSSLAMVTTMTTTTTTITTGSANAIITATTITSIHRSESYRRIIEAEDDHVGFFTRFRNRPSMRFVNIERIPPTRGVKFLEFFNVRRERKIYETFPGGKHLIKVFSKEGDYSDEVPTAFSEKPESLRRLKERQLDRRFWKQLSKRRGNKPIQLSA
ncbi:PREDICTED: uncharacterized protein LOC108564844 isoform X3 [Nicrophorus vespilloides]|uniref:Uncharacterized protein LOC108564844 isoform X3 n=1 Tax=Nicrophorus vespilloides TaxID=110193 RepID=A0ABM1MY44_NICVS|nr:PREDICTED: uncharacterized protein LOC108564844 isoform X3 [Nicrophorus vespilloides]